MEKSSKKVHFSKRSAITRPSWGLTRPSCTQSPYCGVTRPYFGGSRGAEPPWWGVWGAKPPSWIHEELHGRSIEDLSILHPSIHQLSMNHPSTIHASSINYPSTIIRSSFDHTSMDIYISMDINYPHPTKFKNQPSSCLGGNREAKSIDLELLGCPGARYSGATATTMTV